MKIAVFPGSFDPFTYAHKDLVDRSLSLFDKIYIAIGVNSSKKGLLDHQQRKESIMALYASENKVVVDTFTGLTVDYCKTVGAKFILRGLRNTSDFDFENAIAQNNLILEPSIETYFLLSRSQYSHISSTIVRDILLNNGTVDSLVPEQVRKYIQF